MIWKKTLFFIVEDLVATGKVLIAVVEQEANICVKQEVGML